MCVPVGDGDGDGDTVTVTVGEKCWKRQIKLWAMGKMKQVDTQNDLEQPHYFPNRRY
jgi:hypothetical protein